MENICECPNYQPEVLILTNIKEDICERNSSSSEIFTDSTNSTNSARTYKFVNQPQFPCECFPKNSEENFGEFDSQKNSKKIPKKIQKIAKKIQKIESTLAIIKPEAVKKRPEIERKIKAEGFEIQKMKFLKLSSEKISDFYGDNYGNSNFARLVDYMTSGTIIVYVLARKDAVERWRIIIGPTKVSEARLYFPDSIRARYGIKSNEDYKNAVHGSANDKEAEREIHFFFPDFIIEPLIQWKEAEKYLSETINKILAEGLSLCCKEKPEEPILWLGKWLLANNPNTQKQ